LYTAQKSLEYGKADKQMSTDTGKSHIIQHIYFVKFTNGGLSFSLFHFPFSFLIFLFLEHRVRVRSQDTENKVEGSRTNDVIQHGYHMLISYSIHSHLG